MKRRHFIATAVAALAGVATRRPQPEPPLTNPLFIGTPRPPAGWEVSGYTYVIDEYDLPTRTVTRRTFTT